jgi:predicted dehydrogenase
MDQTVTRREALKCAAASIGVPMIVPASALGRDGRPAPSERITLGSIGTGGFNPNNDDSMGTYLLKAFMGRRETQMLAVCDVDATHRSRAKRIVDEHYGASRAAAGCSAVNDFRDIISRKDIDAVIIALPDHWHAIPVIMAARAKKDIYAEKPLALTVAEGRQMADEVKRHKVVFQTGSQLRSVPWVRRGCELVRAGRIGKVRTIRCSFAASPACPPQPEMPVPEGFDYDRWLGPAPRAPYTKLRCHFNFRWILDYSDGQVSDHGAHYVDIAQWGLGTERSGPVEVEGRGDFPSEGLFNVATAYHIEWTYANGVKMIGEEKGRDIVCTTFEGSEGTVHIGNGLQTEPASLARSEAVEERYRLPDINDHHGNFLDCVRSRKTPLAPIEEAHRSAAICHIGNIAMLLKRKLRWDPARERFVGDAEANRMLVRRQRSPWTLKEMS